MTNWIQSVKVFLLWFVLMLLVFGWGSARLANRWVELDASWLYLLFALQQIVTIGILWVSLWKWWRPWRDGFVAYFDKRNQRKWRWLFWKRVVGWFVAYMIINGLLYTLVQSMWWTIPWLYGDQSVMQILQDMNISTTIDWIMTILMIVIVWPIVEELVYRWLITDALMQKRRRRGVILAAFIFALIHLEFAVFRNLFLLALILWVIYYKTWSMRYSFLFHVIINGMWILALWLQESGLVPEM